MKFLQLLEFENVVKFEDETFKGTYAVYTRDNIIKLKGDVSIDLQLDC